LAHLLSSSSVANTDVIGDPYLISKASRASRMAKPPFSNTSSVPMLLTRPRFAKGISNNPFAAWTLFNECRCDLLWYTTRDPLLYR